jgi:hypothetical protein
LELPAPFEACSDPTACLAFFLTASCVFRRPHGFFDLTFFDRLAADGLFPTRLPFFMRANIFLPAFSPGGPTGRPGEDRRLNFPAARRKTVA